MMKADCHPSKPRTSYLVPRTSIYIALLFLVLTSCRRDLWIYTDDLHQVQLLTDWSQATQRPGGMTWWFMSETTDGTNYHGTSGNVTQTWLGLPRDRYEGVVFDYSPSEYAHQEFTGMDSPKTALVRLLPSADQPQPDDILFGQQAVPGSMSGVPFNSTTGMYVVSAEPEVMNADTLRHRDIVTGYTSDHILWNERDKYESQEYLQTLRAQPKPLIWELKLRVHVKGIKYMGSVRGTIVGLTDGCWLVPMRHTSSTCMQRLDNWTRTSLTDSTGYISTTVHTFGLPDPEMPASSDMLTRSYSGEVIHTYTENLRVNLQFLLRDQVTVKNYQFNVGANHITIYDSRLEVDVELPIDFPNAPDLPEVDAVDTAGFGADVTPWDNGGQADTTM